MAVTVPESSRLTWRHVSHFCFRDSSVTFSLEVAHNSYNRSEIHHTCAWQLSSDLESLASGDRTQRNLWGPPKRFREEISVPTLRYTCACFPTEVLAYLVFSLQGDTQCTGDVGMFIRCLAVSCTDVPKRYKQIHADCCSFAPHSEVEIQAYVFLQERYVAWVLSYLTTLHRP
jgi:hypothetical protein